MNITQPHIIEKHKAIVLPYRSDIANLAPHAKPMQVNGGTYLVLPHKNEETKLLRNLGFDLPSPILSQYNWPGETPFDVQKKTAALVSTNRRVYVLNDMGTGKTRAVLYAADYLMQLGDVRRALIVAPLSTLNPVWRSELFRYFGARSTAVLHCERKRRKRLMEADFDFYIVNHDGIHIIKDEVLARKDIDLIIIDELAAFRTANTRRWKAMRDLIYGKHMPSARKYVWGLTGAPTPNAPTDAWAQARLLTPDRVPQYFGRFRDRTMLQVSQFRWVPRRDANDTVFHALKPSIRFARSECVDLPPTSYVTRTAALSDTQKRFYKALMEKFQIQYRKHEITAANEGVKLGKLLQVCTGYVYTNEKKTLGLNPQHKLAALKEILEGTSHKIIVFVPFVHALQQISAFIRSNGYSTEVVYGATPKNARDNIFNDFSHGTDPHVLVAHPKTMAHGLTLVSADTVVWYSPTTSPEIYEQANARITRPGQNNHTYIAHLESAAVEARVFRNLQTKVKMQGMLLDMFEKGTPAEIAGKNNP